MHADFRSRWRKLACYTAQAADCPPLSRAPFLSQKLLIHILRDVMRHSASRGLFDGEER